MTSNAKDDGALSEEVVAIVDEGEERQSSNLCQDPHLMDMGKLRPWTWLCNREEGL